MKRSPAYAQPNDKVTEMNTLSACLNKAIRDGYTNDFEITSKGLHALGDPDKYYGPDDIHIPNFYRFEGESDPGDMSILYVIETPDGKKGTLIDAYGAYADGRVNAFIVQVMNIQKHVDKANREHEIPDASARV